MNSLSAAMLLQVWERNRGQGPVTRAISLLTAARPGLTTAGAFEMPVGDRDQELLTLRESIFGPDVDGITDCPSCGARVETNFQVRQIRSDSRAAPEFTVTAGPYTLRARAPNSSDLAAVTTRRELLTRCVLVEQTEIPDDALDALEAGMALADPQSNIQLALACPACGRSWLALFDIVSFFWREIDAWARRILREVHVLASVYGWSEAEILSLSAWRRQFYLEQIAWENAGL